MFSLNSNFPAKHGNPNVVVPATVTIATGNMAGKQSDETNEVGPGYGLNQ